jgi:hypothetical protein
MLLKVEKSLRLDTFYEDVPIVLGNGEAFHCHPPRMVYFPTFDADGVMMLGQRLNYGPAWEDKFEQASHKDTPAERFVSLIFWFADRMLLGNYDQKIRAYYPDLLYVNESDRVSTRILMTLWGLVQGVNPRRTYLGWVKATLAANNVPVAGLTMTEIMEAFLYVSECKLKELDAQEHNPFMPSTIKYLSYNEYMYMGPTLGGEEPDAG